MEYIGVSAMLYTKLGTLLALASAPLLLFSIIVLTRRHHSSSLPLPPGIRSLPFLGETLELLNDAKENRFVHFVRSRVAKYGDVFRTSLFLCPAIVIHGAEANRFLYSNDGTLVQEWLPAAVLKLLGENAFVLLSGEQHRQVRRLVLTYIHRVTLQKAAVARVDMLTQQHFDKQWLGRDKVTLCPLVRSHILNVAIILVLGLDKNSERLEEVSRLVQLVVDGLLTVPIYLPGTCFYQACMARGALTKLLDEVISERRKEMDAGESAEKDLISSLVSAKDQEGNTAFTEMAIKDLVIFLLFAGHDTTTSTVALVCKYLCENPDCYEEVLKEQTAIANSKKLDEKLDWEDIQKMKYTWAVIQETIRKDPPGPAFMRVALKDFEFGGFRIPRGWKIFHSLASCYVDERYFPDPQKFDPSRFLGTSAAPPYTFYPFGGGRHSCVGMDFARMTMSVYFHNIVTKFKWTLANPKERITLRPTPIPVDGLPILLEERRLLRLQVCPTST